MKRLWLNLSIVLLMLILLSAFAAETIINTITVSGVTVSVYQNSTDNSIRLVFSGEGSIGADLFKENALASFVPDTARVDIGAGITGVDDGAFLGFEKLAIVSIEQGVTSIGESAFADNTALSQVTIGKNVTTIGSNAFQGCSSLESVTFQAECETTAIGTDAFAQCTSLKSITLPPQLKTLAQSIFSGCTALSEITLNDQLEVIDDNAFDGCIALKALVIPSKVTKIGSSVFNGCIALYDVTFKGEPKTITDKKDLFSALFVGIVRYDLPDGDWKSTNVYCGYEKTYAYCTSQSLVSNLTAKGKAYQCIGVSPIPSYDQEEATCQKEGRTGALECSLCGARVSEGNVTPKLPHQPGNASCTPATNTSDGTISKIICKLCNEVVLESITISYDRIYALPDSCITIEKGAFSNTAQQQIVIPDSVVTIGEEAFAYDHDLVLIVCPENLIQQATNALGEREWFTVNNESGSVYIVLIPEAE